MISRLRRRTLVKIVSYSLAVVLGLTGAAVSGFVLASKYRMDLEYGYRRALSDLTTYVSNIETTLNKGLYANTPTEQNGLAGMLTKQSCGAKGALAQLPLADVKLDAVNKFISQVGDFSTTLSKQVSGGQTITDEQFKNIEQLSSYAKGLELDLQDVEARFGDGTLFIGDAKNAINNISKETQPNAQQTVMAKSFSDIQEESTDYPTLIYDGPFSDHIGQMKPRLTEGKAQITQDDALKIAAEFLKVSPSALQHGNDSAGDLPTYGFTGQNTVITVTQYGGFVAYMTNSRGVADEKLSNEDAISAALAFLKSRGIESMRESYYVKHDGICTINFAYVQNDITLYPDLTKVSVALDNGEIVGFESTGYIMNHYNRTIPKPKLALTRAEGSVSPRLKIEKEGMALIPTPGLKEVLTYEFECTGLNNEKVLVYINANTGLEEQIYIVQLSDGGILVT